MRHANGHGERSGARGSGVFPTSALVGWWLCVCLFAFIGHTHCFARHTVCSCPVKGASHEREKEGVLNGGLSLA